MATVSLTNYASQVAEIERQKKLAELLQQQAQQPIEIQSYKGTQAPIPWSAVLAKVLGQVGGQIKEARAIKQAGALKEAGMAEALRQYGDTNKMAEQLTPMAQAPSGPSMATPAQTAIALGGVPTLGGSVGPSAPQAGMMPGMKAAAPVAAPAPAPVARPLMTPQEQQQAGLKLAFSGLPNADVLGKMALEKGLTQEKAEKFLDSFGDEMPKDENGKSLVNPKVIAAFVNEGDRTGALKYMVDAGVNHEAAVQKMKELEVSIADKAATREETAAQREADRASRETIAQQTSADRRAMADQASADRRAIAAQSSADRRASMAAIAATRPGPRLQGKQADALSAAGTALDASERLLAGVKDSYFHPFTGNLNPETWKFLPGNTDQKAWWQDYNAAIAQKRHELFGTALTKTELPSWEKLIVTTSTDPTLARANLAKQKAIEARAAVKLASGAVSQGYNPQAVEDYIGRPLSELANAGPVTAAQAGYGKSTTPAPYADPNKEAAYQAWKKANGK